MSTETPKKHVIILGAGASATSGYPLANRLRLLMSSEQVLKAELAKFNGPGLDQVFATVFDERTKQAVELFRHGGFATIDEFSYLARGKFAKEVQSLKRLLRFALALQDPEDKFQDSDYYLFIQKLFHKELFPLRNDYAILTFNYDPYLPYLLSKAYRTRCKALGKQCEENAVNAITSAFSWRLVGPLEQGNELCVLQLHGCIAWPTGSDEHPRIWYYDLFGNTLEERVKRLCASSAARTVPPIIFPWEIFTERGEIINEREFCLKHDCDPEAAQGGYGGIRLHQIFESIWKRARREINAATTISFVGLSMHEFLTPAFKYLFQERKNDAQLVCANWEHRNFSGGSAQQRVVEVGMNPLSPTFKLRRLLKEICPFLKGANSYGTMTWPDQGPTVRIREDFKDFIANEME